ncbi:hypothetical protein ACYUYA_02355 [Enterococcus faecium]
MNDEYKNDEDKMLFEEIENRCRLNFELRGKMSLIQQKKYLANKSGSILFDVGELHQHLFCIKKYRKDTLKSFRINLATNS